ncbi:MAG: hypothetical protein GF331_22165 [Chitinivibrionales bacterium]|nr:hypothetical protein [Chitinivibrionales bacterium]
MEAKAVVMGLLGFFLLYGGLAACIGIAWYHSRNAQQQERQEQQSTKTARERSESPA